MHDTVLHSMDSHNKNKDVSLLFFNYCFGLQGYVLAQLIENLFAFLKLAAWNEIWLNAQTRF